jgi:hypothetical protein
VLTDITYSHGRLSGLDALEYVSWGRWVTLPLQVMPVFFLVGGYANAVSWTAHSGRGETWTTWVRGRVMRLLWPASVYVVAASLAAGIAMACGVPDAELAQAGWLVALHLWFLPVYLLLIALTPAMLTAQRRWGLAVPVTMAVAVAGVDAGVLGWHLPVVGFANYLLVWGSAHQWGFCWLAWGPFPVDMIGAGERITNTSPPSIALLALAATQAGLLLTAEPAANRLLARPRWWRLVTRLNPKVMTIYLWHMAPVLVVAVALYPSGLMPAEPIGSLRWWVLRLPWFASLTLVLVALVIAVTWAEQPLRLLPAGLGRVGPWSSALLGLGVAAAMIGLTRLALAGFAPGGSVPWPALAAVVGGLLLALTSGRAPKDQARASAAPG